jgi:hypothetical protein
LDESPSDINGDYAKEIFADNSILAARLRELNVRIRAVTEIINSSTLYDYYDENLYKILRVDADSAFSSLTEVAGCFSYSLRIGESGLNHRHTGRNGFEQLFHNKSGRMYSWEPQFHRSPREFLNLTVESVKQSVGLSLSVSLLQERMKERSWPSEGLSYLDTALLTQYRLLRNALQLAQVIPTWDEEIIKLLLASVLDLEIERARIPVLEYYEYRPSTHQGAVINFRNGHRLRPIIRGLLREGGPTLESHLGYIREFVEGF